MPLKNDWVNGDLFTPVAANDMADAVNNFNSLVFDAREYGVIADGSPHNNVANLLDCFSACEAAGGGTVLLPAGTIVTSEADLGTVTADSGNTYTNNGGIPLPVDTPITVEGHGVGNTVIKLSTGFPRAFDFWYTAAGELYRDITIRRLTVDRNNLTGAAIAPLSATSGAASLSPGVWTTLPGLSASTFRNAGLVWFDAGNAGTSKNRAMKARVSGSNVQVRNDSATTYTVNSGDQVKGSLRDHVIVGTRQFGNSVPGGWDTTINGLVVEDVDSVNVSTETAATLSTAKSDVSVNILISVQNVEQDDAQALNCVVRNVRMYGGESGAVIEGQDGTFVDRCFFIDSFHDTMVDPPSNYVSANFMLGQNAWVGTVGLVRCHGRRSGDVAVEIDQPWLAYEVDCLWEDSYSGVYNTSFVPPARTAAGPPTTTLGTNISGSWDGSSAITPTFGALPADVSRSGIVKIDSELFWYTTTNDAGTAVSLMRSLNGSTVAAHTAGATVTFVETAKTRIHSVRSTVRNRAVMNVTGGGLAFASFENSTLPLPPLTISDATVDIVGGNIAEAGQCFKQFGWRPDLDIQGLRYNQMGAGGSGAASNQFGSAVALFWNAGSSITTLYPIPAPRVFGRNNTFHIQGVATSNYYYYTAFRGYTGYARLDFDLTTEIALRNAGSGRVSAVYLAGEGSTNKYRLAPGSRVELTNRTISGVGTDAFSVGLNLGDSTILPITEMLEVDIDSSGMTFSAGGSSDLYYSPWRIPATNVDKVRFGKVIHSSSATSAYPQDRVPTRRITTNHTVTGSDSVIQVDTTSSAVTVTLPRLTGGDTSLGGQPLARGQQITIVDVGFNSATNAITVTPNAADKIDNGTAGASVTITNAGASLTLVAHPEQPGWVTVKGSSANKLTTARTINGVSFDGTANITVADATKEPTITAGTTSQYYRGDKTFQTLDKSAVGLGNVDNTSNVTERAATASLTNKNLTSETNTFPTFNQNTTGSAATLTTARTIDGQSFDGSANITVIAPGTVAATAKTTPVDADVIPLADSAASNVLKKLSWANLVATLKTYFDSVSTTLSSKTLAAPALTGTTKVAQSGALEIYNTADQTTNYERAMFTWIGNVGYFYSEKGGTGTLRQIRFGNGSNQLIVSGSAQSTGSLAASCVSSAAGIAQFGVGGTLSSSSGTQTGLIINPALSQTSTAGYTALLINPTETTTGSGTKRLIDAQVGSSSKFTVDNAGTVSISGTAATIRAGAGSPESVVTANIGSIYTRTDGGAGTTLYIKESGTGNTGWIAK